MTNRDAGSLVTAKKTAGDRTARREIAERRVARYLRENIGAKFEGHAEDIVHEVIEALGKPDQAMVDAGFAELTLAVPKQVARGNVRLLVTATWHAMVGRTG